MSAKRGMLLPLVPPVVLGGMVLSLLATVPVLRAQEDKIHCTEPGAYCQLNIDCLGDAQCGCVNNACKTVS